ncbi:MAG: hypothetical protein HOV66_16440 [Streptomycetaceae bacterium]|nr:hypothetical protein [Streptomycetaceae bacterium]NUS56421.1 hypothetical protein [Streptomycetaceae bacterium]
MTDQPGPRQPLTDLVTEALRTASLPSLWRMCVDIDSTPPFRIDLAQLRVLAEGGRILRTDKVLRALTAGLRGAGLAVDFDAVVRAADVQFPPVRSLVYPFPGVPDPSVAVTMAMSEHPSEGELADAEEELRRAIGKIAELRRAAEAARKTRHPK